MIGYFFSLAIGAILIENFVLVKFLGVCPFVGVSKKMETAIGMGLALTFTMTIASVATWLANYFILDRFNLEFLQTITFILLVASLVQVVEMVLQKYMPALYSALGIYLPLITTNCAVLGSVLLNMQKSHSLIEAVVFGCSAAIGITLAICLLASVRERMEFCEHPKCFEGFPMVLITAGIFALAFMGFSGLKIF